MRDKQNPTFSAITSAVLRNPRTGQTRLPLGMYRGTDTHGMLQDGHFMYDIQVAVE